MNNELLYKILDNQATIQSLAIEVSNRTYHLVSTIFEHLESTQTIAGNGHHIAQNFARAAELMVIARHVKSPKEEKEKARKEETLSRAGISVDYVGLQPVVDRPQPFPKENQGCVPPAGWKNIAGYGNQP